MAKQHKPDSPTDPAKAHAEAYSRLSDAERLALARGETPPDSDRMADYLAAKQALDAAQEPEPKKEK